MSKKESLIILTISLFTFSLAMFGDSPGGRGMSGLGWFLIIAECVLIGAVIVWILAIWNDQESGRVALGGAIAGLGLMLLIHTLFNWRTMPKAFLAWETKIEREVPVTKLVYKNYPNTGPVRIEARWESTEKENKGSAVGKYQLRRIADNTILVVEFCNQPHPDFIRDMVVDITHDKVAGKECSWLVEAKVISEPEVKHK
jgi:hypothetical protein